MRCATCGETVACRWCRDEPLLGADNAVGSASGNETAAAKLNQELGDASREDALLLAEHYRIEAVDERRKEPATAPMRCGAGPSLWMRSSGPSTRSNR